MKAQPKFFQSEHFRNFWEKGNGRELIQWAGYQPDIKDFDNYSHLYYQVDETADAAVQDTYLKMPYKEASEIIHQFSTEPVSVNSDAPESLKKMFLEMQTVPDWFNEDLANAGARFCMRTGTNALIILRDFTLMGGYDFAYLNKPLIFRALKKGAVKRLKDTLEFWVHVTRENALKINSQAYQLIVRTRLMHSYARLTIRKKVPEWDYENWGEPINHWDMVATYTGFSLVTLQGLKKLGIQISEKEELGVYHLWKYVGYLLGIPPEYLPENRQQAVKQLYLWSALQAEGDKDSAALAKALLDENLENTIYPLKFQRKLLLSLHRSMNWFLLDKEVNERLKIPIVSSPNLFPQMILKANRISGKLFKIHSPKGYQKLVEFGNKNQLKVLDDYIKHAPRYNHN